MISFWHANAFLLFGRVEGVRSYFKAKDFLLLGDFDSRLDLN